MCSRTNVLTSRIRHASRALDGFHEVAPVLALLGEHLAPGRRELVVAAAPLAGFLDPRAGDQPAPLEPIQNRIERRDVERHRACRALADANRDLVTVTPRVLELGEHEQLGRALLERALVQRAVLYVRHMYESYIWRSITRKSRM